MKKYLVFVAMLGVFFAQTASANTFAAKVCRVTHSPASGLDYVGAGTVAPGTACPSIASAMTWMYFVGNSMHFAKTSAVYSPLELQTMFNLMYSLKLSGKTITFSYTPSGSNNLVSGITLL